MPSRHLDRDAGRYRRGCLDGLHPALIRGLRKMLAWLRRDSESDPVYQAWVLLLLEMLKSLQDLYLKHPNADDTPRRLARLILHGREPATGGRRKGKGKGKGKGKRPGAAWLKGLFQAKLPLPLKNAMRLAIRRLVGPLCAGIGPSTTKKVDEIWPRVAGGERVIRTRAGWSLVDRLLDFERLGVRSPARFLGLLQCPRFRFTVSLARQALRRAGIDLSECRTQVLELRAAVRSANPSDYTGWLKVMTGSENIIADTKWELDRGLPPGESASVEDARDLVATTFLHCLPRFLKTPPPIPQGRRPSFFSPYFKTALHHEVGRWIEDQKKRRKLGRQVRIQEASEELAKKDPAVTLAINEEIRLFLIRHFTLAEALFLLLVHLDEFTVEESAEAARLSETDVRRTYPKLSLLRAQCLLQKTLEIEDPVRLDTVLAGQRGCVLAEYRKLVKTEAGKRFRASPRAGQDGNSRHKIPLCLRPEFQALVDQAAESFLADLEKQEGRLSLANHHELRSCTLEALLELQALHGQGTGQNGLSPAIQQEIAERQNGGASIAIGNPLTAEAFLRQSLERELNHRKWLRGRLGAARVPVVRALRERLKDRPHDHSGLHQAIAEVLGSE